MVKMLLKLGADPNAKTRASSLRLAAGAGFKEVVELLLDYGADPDHQHPEDGVTALVMAVKKNHRAVVEVLLEEGGTFAYMQHTGPHHPPRNGAGHRHCPAHWWSLRTAFVCLFASLVVCCHVYFGVSVVRTRYILKLSTSAIYRLQRAPHFTSSLVPFGYGMGYSIFTYT